MSFRSATAVSFRSESWRPAGLPRWWCWRSSTGWSSRIGLRVPGGRTRQPRLGLVDAFSLDGQRQLVLVRRDNVEHLVMIGGPNDVLVESQINRALAPARESNQASPSREARGTGAASSNLSRSRRRLRRRRRRRRSLLRPAPRPLRRRRTNSRGPRLVFRRAKFVRTERRPPRPLPGRHRPRPRSRRGGPPSAAPGSGSPRKPRKRAHRAGLRWADRCEGLRASPADCRDPAGAPFGARAAVDAASNPSARSVGRSRELRALHGHDRPAGRTAGRLSSSAPCGAREAATAPHPVKVEFNPVSAAGNAHGGRRDQDPGGLARDPRSGAGDREERKRRRPASSSSDAPPRKFEILAPAKNVDPKSIEKAPPKAEDPFAGLDFLEAEMARLLGRDKPS